MNTLALITPPNTDIRCPEQPIRAVGIDLGTTNSTIAEVLWIHGDQDGPRVRCVEVEQPTRQGNYIHTLTPSVVALHEGRVYVGEGAKDLRARPHDYKLERNTNIFWDCKNDIGVRRTYHKAPPGYRSAKDIGGRVVRFLVDAALVDDPTPITCVVVTAPASFQAAQRQDTVEAAALAGLSLDEGGLLDEPVAAFIDYLVQHGAQAFRASAEPQLLAVFDFGGGTCDVALFDLLPTEPGQAPRIAPLTVSRYHRLGGGDIDRAIVTEVLLPQLIEQNSLTAPELDFEAKDKFIIPALLGVAESLKIGLCREITRLKRFQRYTDETRASLVQKNPGSYTVPIPGHPELRLQSPRLSAIEFDALLAPFLDHDLLYARESDYGLTCTIFAPLQDALDRAGVGPEDIDLCLMVGGSTLIPQVSEALGGFFNNARSLSFQDADVNQTAVARGAAWQALALALYGRGVIQPVASDEISIQTSAGPVVLVRSGSPLPYPGNGDWAVNHRLVVPKSSLHETIPIRVELRDSRNAILFSRIWELDPPVNQGDPLLLRYRIDANQVLHLHLFATEGGGPEIRWTLENPLTNVVNPNAKRDRIAGLEETMRTQALPAARQREIVEEIALLYADLGQRERALSLLARLLKGGPDGYILNRMGIICGEQKDFVRQERLYRESARVAAWGIPLFNLALSQKRQGQLAEAMSTIDQAISRDPEPPYLVLKADIAHALKQFEQQDIVLHRAFEAYGPPRTLSDWSLGWYLTAAQLAGDTQRQAEAETERNRRRRETGCSVDTGGILPGTKTEIARQ